jgi:glycosyltransferase involved in cell wall biosynthesis
MGGPISSIYNLNNSLVKKGMNVTVYTTNAALRDRKDIFLKSKINLRGVKIFYFPYFGYVHWTFSPSLFWAVKKNINDFDLVHITGVWNFPVFAAAFWARFYGKPYIISPRGSLMKKPLAEKKSIIKKIYLALIAKRDLENASAIHFTAEREKEDYLDADLDFKSFFVAPNALDPVDLDKYKKTSFRKKFKISEKEKVILFLGRINWVKGFDTLIPAFAEVLKKESDCLLVIAGESNYGCGGYKKEVEGLAEKFKIGRKVLFTGMLLGEDKAGAFRESDVFAAPSYSENFGMSVIEAMHCGLPVIVSDGVGISFDIVENDAGVVVKKDAKEFADAILELLKNKELSSKIGENGRKFVKNKYFPDALADDFLRQYEKIIDLYGIL